MASGICPTDDCITAYSDIRNARKNAYVLYKITAADEGTTGQEIVVEKLGDVTSTFDDFVKDLPHDQPRYAVVDFKYKPDDGRPETSKLLFVYWCPDSCNIRTKMVYSSSKDALKMRLKGLHEKEVQANDYSGLDALEIQRSAGLH